MALAKPISEGLLACLRDHAGLDLPAWVVESRASIRMEALGIDGRAYLELCRSKRGHDELRALVEAVRVGETRFFRHRPQVDAVLEFVIPAWKERGHKAPRVWSAGCASGEEPYTLALVLDSEMPRPAYEPTVLATDVSAEAIAFAKRGEYSRAVRETIPEPWRTRVRAEGEKIRVPNEIAEIVTFERRNLAGPNQPRGFDLVWCRNVLIYFEADARARAVDKLSRALEPGGFLFVGYSESLRDATTLVPVKWRDQVLWQKPVPRTTVAGVAVSPARSARAAEKPKLGRDAPPPSSHRPKEKRTRIESRPHAERHPRTERHAAIIRATEEASALAREIGDRLRAPNLSLLTIDLDTADVLDDEFVPVIRRARAAAEAAGIDLVLHANRAPTKRWLRRHGLGGHDP